MKAATSPNPHVFELWEETGVPRENLGKPEEMMIPDEQESGDSEKKKTTLWEDIRKKPLKGPDSKGSHPHQGDTR